MKTSVSSGVYRIEHFGTEVLAGYSGREYEHTRRDAFLTELGVDPAALVQIRQIHSANLFQVEPGKRPDAESAGDGLITSELGIALGMLTADCAPIFYWDPVRRVAALAHAGWRGLYHGITGKVIQVFRQRFASRPEDVLVALGPAIRSCCYEVGREFADFFGEHYRPPVVKNGKGRMDLVARIHSDLKAEGVVSHHIQDCEICTVCQKDRFFSARGDGGTKERILSVIQILG